MLIRVIHRIVVLYGKLILPHRSRKLLALCPLMWLMHHHVEQQINDLNNQYRRVMEVRLRLLWNWRLLQRSLQPVLRFLLRRDIVRWTGLSLPEHTLTWQVVTIVWEFDWFLQCFLESPLHTGKRTDSFLVLLLLLCWSLTHLSRS